MAKPAHPSTEIFRSWLNVDGAVEAKETELQEAQRVVRKLTDVDRDPATRSGIRLVSPGCALGCTSCFRACAVNRIKLGWWAKELAALSEARP